MPAIVQLSLKRQRKLRKSPTQTTEMRSDQDSLGEDGGRGGFSSHRFDASASRCSSRSAGEACKKAAANSVVLNGKRERRLPRFSRDELKIGQLLGSGAFNNVFEVSAIELDQATSEALQDDTDPQGDHRNKDNGERGFVAGNCTRGKGGDCRYAIKTLKTDVMSDPDLFAIGAADLAVEAKFLASLVHPNIIKIRGMTHGGVEGFATGLEGGYFLVLDRLYDTLENQIYGYWKNLHVDLSSSGTKSCLGRTNAVSEDEIARQRDFLAERLNVAFDVAGALQHLHSKNIIYRDLKPDNLAFDVRGDVKLFDLGLAKELLPGMRNENGAYMISGTTGTPRYMAPEVYKNQPYDLSADVYSFSLLLWEILTLEKPFGNINRKKLERSVVYGKSRPWINPAWPIEIKSILERCWGEPDGRPTMKTIYTKVRVEVTKLRNGNDSGLEHSRRRSTVVFQKFSMRDLFASSRNLVSTRNVGSTRKL